MTTSRALRFSSIALPPGRHVAAWRHPAAQATPELDLTTIAAYARRLEEAGFSALIVADAAAVWGEQLDSTEASSFEPLTLLSALATLTDRIGLVATTTTSFNEPFHVARRLASLDHISGGRAGWNVDTSVTPRQAGGFARSEPEVHEERYERADEFVQVVRGLWDSYADDAIVADKQSGLYFRPGARRPLDHAGKHFRVAGPLNVSRPPQGHPVVFQAAADSAGIVLASRQADVMLTAARRSTTRTRTGRGSATRSSPLVERREASRSGQASPPSSPRPNTRQRGGATNYTTSSTRARNARTYEMTSRGCSSSARQSRSPIGSPSGTRPAPPTGSRCGSR